MLRAGLTVTAGELAAGEQLAARLALGRAQLWGMAPFGGVAEDPVWTAAVTSPLLSRAPECTPIQAAFRVAFGSRRSVRSRWGSVGWSTCASCLHAWVAA